MFICEKCKKEFKNIQSLNSHIGWHNKPNRKSNFIEYNILVKNGFLNKENSNQFTKSLNNGFVYKVSDETKEKISMSMKGKKLTEKHKENISISMKKAVLENPGSYSYKNISGRVKNIDYNGFILKGSWELIFAKWLDSNNIRWTNVINGIPYVWNDSEHLYFPDFYLIDYNLFVEIKGYQRKRDLYKWENVKNLIIIRKKEIDLINNNNFGLVSALAHNQLKP